MFLTWKARVVNGDISIFITVCCARLLTKFEQKYFTYAYYKLFNAKNFKYD